MRLLMFIIAIPIVALAVSLNAQMYEYKDSAGNVWVTDNFGNIPEEYRDNVMESRGVHSFTDTSDYIEISRDSSPGSEVVNNQRYADIEDPALQEAALRKEKAELQKEYESLMEVKAKIGNPPKADAPIEEHNAYEQIVHDINTRIESYQEKLEEHIRRVEVFNSKFGN